MVEGRLRLRRVFLSSLALLLSQCVIVSAFLSPLRGSASALSRAKHALFASKPVSSLDTDAVPQRLTSGEEFVRNLVREERKHQRPPYLATESVRAHSRLLNGVRMRRLPHSDLVVSEVGLGTLTFGEQVDKALAFRMLDLAVKEYGINFIDTSEIFPGPYKQSTCGNAERIVGAWLAQQPASLRDNLVISAKICGHGDAITWCREGERGTRVTREEILSAVDNTCRRLRTDRIDLFSLHWPARYVPMFGEPHYDRRFERETISLSEEMQIMQELIQCGKIRTYGVSNETPFGLGMYHTIANLTGLPAPVAVQAPFSIMERTVVERDLAEACSPHNADMAMIAFSPLAGGALSGKYSNPGGVTLDESRLRKFSGFMHRYLSTPSLKTVLRLEDVAQRYDVPMFVMALAWVYSRPYVGSTLIGATSLQQLEENILALNLLPLPHDIQERVDAFCRDNPEPCRGVFPLTSTFPGIDFKDMPWGVHDNAYVDPQVKELLDRFSPDKGQEDE